MTRVSANPPSRVVLHSADGASLTFTDLSRCQNGIGFGMIGRLVPRRRWDVLLMPALNLSELKRNPILETVIGDPVHSARYQGPSGVSR
jgi:hypothetical protein